ncbi:hypothetical protein [Antrihabitans spumae]|uniref:Uncharacterized protein n=1 Tax=Antrihabitans spumae TaxID=3373370 RepID=A0ABW7JJE0_9NOCA
MISTTFKTTAVTTLAVTGVLLSGSPAQAATWIPESAGHVSGNCTREIDVLPGTALLERPDLSAAVVTTGTGIRGYRAVYPDAECASGPHGKWRLVQAIGSEVVNPNNISTLWTLMKNTSTGQLGWMNNASADPSNTFFVS